MRWRAQGLKTDAVGGLAVPGAWLGRDDEILRQRQWAQQNDTRLASFAEQLNITGDNVAKTAGVRHHGPHFTLPALVCMLPRRQHTAHLPHACPQLASLRRSIRQTRRCCLHVCVTTSSKAQRDGDVLPVQRSWLRAIAGRTGLQAKRPSSWANSAQRLPPRRPLTAHQSFRSLDHTQARPWQH